MKQPAAKETADAASDQSSVISLSNRLSQFQ